MNPLNDKSDHDRLIHVEAVVSVMQLRQERFEEEQKEDRRALHDKIDRLTTMFEAQMNRAKGVLWLVGAIVGALGFMWGWLSDHLHWK